MRPKADRTETKAMPRQDTHIPVAAFFVVVTIGLQAAEKTDAEGMKNDSGAMPKKT